MKRWLRDARGMPEGGYLPAVDGVRVLAIFIISWFHIWQQSWLYPAFRVLGLEINAEPVVRSGYIWVDIMILLSGFCLQLPAARQKRDTPVLPFYRRRFLRIYPSYLFSVLVMFAVALWQGLYGQNTKFLIRDLVSHLTMTQMFRMDTYYYTNLNAALWTLCLEAQLYLIFPLLSRGMVRRPVLTAAPMLALGCGVRFFLYQWGGDVSLYFNQLPAYIDVFVLGMLCAHVQAFLETRRRHVATTLLWSAGTVLALYALFSLSAVQAANPDTELIRLGQVRNRTGMACLGAGLILCAANAGLLVRTLFGNPVTHFLTGVSMQYYIWHQVLAVWISRSRIIPSRFENPNFSGDYLWQRTFSLTAFLGALLLAVILTYALERPLFRRFSTRRKKNG